jgi:ribose transport system substrate-binding protein
MRYPGKAVAAALVLTLVVGCGSDDDSGGSAGGGSAKAERIAIVFPTLDAPFTQFIAAGARAQDRRTPEVAVDISTSNQLTDTQQQIRKIEDALTRQPAGLAVFPSVAEPLVPSLKRAESQGAKVLVIDQDIPGLESKVAFVGTDNLKGGQQAGRHMLEQLDSGKVGIIGSSPGITSTDARVKGFKEAIEGSDLRIVSELRADCDRAKAQSAMEDMLSAHPDLKGLFSVCDNSALGAARAIINKDRAKQIFHIGFDGSPEAVDALVKGDGAIDADIAQNPYKMGQETAKALAAALSDRQVPKVIDTGTDVVTTENATRFQDRAKLLG